MARFFIALLAVAAVWIAVGSGTAAAAMPNHQACLGHDISGYAKDGAFFGAFVSDIAQTTTGSGDEIQAHLAGEIPHEVLPNSCR